jgi:hypothetical protein
MKCKAFIQHSALTTGGLILLKDSLSRDRGKVFGHNNISYQLNFFKLFYDEFSTLIIILLIQAI